LICVLDDSINSFEKAESKASEVKFISPPDDLVKLLGADLLYCPFGATTYHVPGVPTIALIADLLHKDYPFTLTGEQIAEREAYLQKTVRDATLLQSISRSGMERMIEHYKVPANRLFYTYLPVHTRFDRAETKPSATAGIGQEKPFFFYPANLWLHKNHEGLLLGYSRYRQMAGSQAWDLVLTFHEEPRADYLRSLARILQISEHVHFLGFLSESALRAVWLRAGALVFPSLHEGFGIPLLEAMHSGIPVITSDQFSLREVAGDACYFIDPRKPLSLSQGLLEMSQNEGLRARLVELGRQRLELFDVKAAARVLCEAFQSLVRTETDLPRKPGYSLVPPLVSTPTPASAGRWKIEVTFEVAPASNRQYSIYLGELPFASFRPGACPKQSFSFVCQPEGRTLALRANGGNGSTAHGCGDEPDLFVTTIVAHKEQGGRILLYEDLRVPTTS